MLLQELKEQAYKLSKGDRLFNLHVSKERSRIGIF